MTEHTLGSTLWATTRDGRRLHAMERPGPGPTPTPASAPAPAPAPAPTVVFEAGAAADRSSWALVQPEVGGFARAVVYDRSGLGRSAPDPAGRTLRRMADDLNDLLDHLGEGPFVLVGHSAGGPVVRAAAAARPERVAGLVLVDPADEAAEVLFGRAFRTGEKVSLLVLRVLARTGLLRRMFARLTAAMPEDVRRDMERESFGPNVVRTQAAQARTFLAELAAWRTAPPTALPTTVISGARPGDGLGPRTRAAANASHAARAAASPRGRHVVAERSAHYVPLTDPEVVVEEIRRLVSPG